MSDWKEIVDLSKSAVIVVDMENDFCHEQGSSSLNGRNVSQTHAIVPNIQKLIDHAHEAGIPVFFIRHVVDETTTSEATRVRQIGRKYPTCVAGSWGTEYFGVQPTEKDIEVIKHRYSAFIRTDLELRLRAMGCETLLMTGVATSTCVESTLRDGYMLDFYTILLKDCTANMLETNDAYEATLNNVRNVFGWVSDSDEICTELKTLVKEPAS